MTQEEEIAQLKKQLREVLERLNEVLKPLLSHLPVSKERAKSMSPSKQQVLVDHVVVETTKPFERVIEVFEGQIGRKGYEAYQHVLTSSRTPEEFTQGIEQLLG